MDAAELFRQHLTVIGQIAGALCRRHGITDHDAEDFVADVRLKLCADDYAIVRKFQGKSSFTTFLTVVISKALVDHHRRIWGKWSPSSQAKRLGTVAVQLETLVYRDGCTFDTARQILQERHGAHVAGPALRTMFAQLPRRTPRRFDGEGELSLIPADEGADSRADASERDAQLAAASDALRRALDDLPDEDRLIIKLLYYEGLTVAEIARGLGLEQPRLYPRIKQLLGSLKKVLTGQGISADFLERLGST
jgi:RNA polymerase sigma factor for flagellar operon FliA